MQIAPDYPRAIGGVDASRAGAGVSIEKIPHSLRGSPVAAAELIGPLLDLPLPAHPPQIAGIGKNFRVQSDEQGRVGVLPRPVGIAHAVGHHTPRLRGGGNHIASGAHTKGIHGILVQMLYQFIIRRGQRRILRAVLGPVYVLLRVFDPHAHGKGLGLHGNFLFLQHGEGIPGAVPDGKHCLFAGDPLSGLGYERTKRTVFLFHSGHLGAKPHLAPQGNDLFSQILHHLQQHIRTHMGLGVI